ncbi:hypothetical protein V8G54_011696 [Vigna mungo]|uniref:Uncharacterized protein n=1 Tax=Vigna mungo TaxID=3915 RepID=A0AAQ3NPL6_VIGMU
MPIHLSKPLTPLQVRLFARSIGRTGLFPRVIELVHRCSPQALSQSSSSSRFLNFVGVIFVAVSPMRFVHFLGVAFVPTVVVVVAPSVIVAPIAVVTPTIVVAPLSSSPLLSIMVSC